VPILMHDWKVDRTTDGFGSVASQTWHQVRRLRLKPKRRGEDDGDLRVPTLAEALDAAKAAGLPLCIELKSREHQPELVRKTVELIRQAGLLQESWLWSFNHLDLEAAHVLAPGLARGTLSLRWPRAEGLAAAEMVVPFAAHQLLVRRRPPELGERPIIVWTVNWPWMARRFAAGGAAGLITDRLDRLTPLFGAAGTGE